MLTLEAYVARTSASFSEMSIDGDCRVKPSSSIEPIADYAT
jgi:hypothetical protein